MVDLKTDIKELLYGIKPLVMPQNDQRAASPGGRGPGPSEPTATPGPGDRGATRDVVQVVPGLLPDLFSGLGYAVGLSEIIAGLKPTPSRPVRDAPLPKDMGGATPGSRGSGMSDPGDKQ